MKNLIIIQHCQSEHHINDLAGGWTDTPLTSLGRKQAAKLAKSLSKEIETKDYEIFSSDLLRSSQTAKIIGNTFGLDIHLTKNFRERNFGIATGKTKKWFDENIIPLENNDELEHKLFDGSESLKEFNERIVEKLEFIDSSGVEKAIIVTHGGVVGHIILWWLNLSLDFFRHSIFGTKVGGVTKLELSWNNKKMLRTLSDDSYVKDNKSH